MGKVIGVNVEGYLGKWGRSIFRGYTFPGELAF